MSRKTLYSLDFKEMVIKEYLHGNASYGELAEKYCVSKRSIRQWVMKYKLHGLDALISKRSNTAYTKEFKMMCVEAVLSGKGSVDDIVAQYNVSSRSVLMKWIKVYNANKELKDYIPLREVYMAKTRRKTTMEERKEIVAYCIEHNRDYKNTANVFDVSYSQVYSWVRKYDSIGEDGLIDRRGHHKTDDEVDELERLRRENLRLQRQLQEKDMLVELLKKVKELERM